MSANYELLKQSGITHILNCASLICKVYHPDRFQYRCLWLLDGREVRRPSLPAWPPLFV